MHACRSTLEDPTAERAGQYAAESSRKRLETEAATPEQYLSSLDMRAEVQPIDESNIDRAVDLITKTNQFNLTTRRHSRATVAEMAAAPRNVCFALKLSDRFGDYGLISVLLGVADDQKTLRLDTWLMSCRAMGRTVEHFALNQLVAKARALGYHSLHAEFLPTAKNQPVKSLLPDFGFTPDAGSATSWSLSLEQFSGVASQVMG